MLFRVGRRGILELVTMRNSIAATGKVTVAKFTDLPTDVEVVDVREDFDNRCFLFTLRHHSFEIVPEGQLLPVHDRMGLGFELVDVAKNERERIAAMLRNVIPGTTGVSQAAIQGCIDLIETLTWSSKEPG